MKSKETLPQNKLKFTLDSSIPKGQKERKKYVADISFFYNSIFKDKLKHFIGLQLEQLAEVGHKEQIYDIFRANINCFRLIDEWMESMSNEHIGNLESLRNSFSDNEEFISKFNQTYNNEN